jgi:MFS family permease
MAALLNKQFAVGPFWFGMISAMPALANATNLLLIPLAGRFMSVRDMTLSMSSINAGLWLCGLISIAFLPLDQPNQVGLFFCIFYACTTLSLSLCVVGWTTWLGDFVPESIRGRYMGRRNRFTNVSTLAFMLLSICLLEWMHASRAAYIILASIAIGGRFTAILYLHLIQSKDPSGGQIVSANWGKDFSKLIKERNFMRFIIFGSFAGFFMGFQGSTGTLFAFDILSASAAEFTGYSIAATVSGTLCVKIWGDAIDRHGAAPILIISFIAWRCGDFGWLFLTEATRHWMFLIWIWGGAMATGYLLASFNLLLKLIPKHSRSSGVSLNLTITSVTGMIAPILGGSLISWATLNVTNVDFVYRLGIFIGLIGSLCSALILKGIKEPNSNPSENTIPGAMRTLRQQTVNQGVAFISSITLISRKRD